MPFPRSGLPNLVTCYELTAGARTADGDRTFTPIPVFVDREGRLYRDRGVESAYIREGTTVDGVVAFRYEPGDLLTSDHSLVVDGVPYDIVYPRRMDTWSRPSHWEVIVRRVS